MQRDGRRPASASQSTRIADLRASLRTTNGSTIKDSRPVPKPPKPPKKAPKRETEEERAVKAERQALAQHTTSLLNGGKSAKTYVRPGERSEPKSGLFFQLFLVLAVVGGVAYALDPTIVPAEWTARAHDFIKQYVKL